MSLLFSRRQVGVLRLVFSGLVLVGLVACSSDAEPADGAPGSSGDVSDDSDDGLPKSMTATLSGDVSKRVECTGANVGVGFLGSAGTGGLFSLTCSGTEKEGDVSVGFGPVGYDFQTVTDLRSVASVERQLTDVGLTYSTQFNGLYLDPTEDGSQSSGWVTVSTVENMGSPPDLPTLVRYRLAGTFRFSAMTSPDDPSEECLQEAIAAGPRHPPYNAELCGSKRVDVEGTFDIVQDVTR